MSMCTAMIGGGSKSTTGSKHMNQYINQRNPGDIPASDVMCTHEGQLVRTMAGMPLANTGGVMPGP